ncbi:MAG: DUF433 domain-containing protein [Chloroflexi bacterium]|nr:DUF433 domain-containing protein [Chloroflexota bacterium]
MELIETAFVAFFRNMGVSLHRLRKARGYIAQTFGFEFPFAEYKFMTEGVHVLMDYAWFEQEAEFKELIVADAGGQLGWSHMLSEKFAEFDYEDVGKLRLAMRWHPASRQSPVIIDPRIAFGAPTVKGLPTWVVKGRWDAGESLEEIVEDFDVQEKDVRHALDFEGISLAA